jgi:hypothetical protein
VAAASSLSDTDFVRLASELVIVSLRLGIEVSRRSLKIDNDSSSWSVAVADASSSEVEASLLAFGQSMVCISSSI